jgi:hypothetical protein
VNIAFISGANTTYSTIRPSREKHMGAIYFDSGSSEYGLMPDRCPDCGPDGGDDAWRYDTACDAPDCLGARFDCCGSGCDAGFPGSRCDAAIAAETDEDRAARHDAERAAFGLPPLND